MTGHHRLNCNAHCRSLQHKVRLPCNNIFDAIGNTPLVKLSKVPKSHGVSDGVNIYVKCEFLNPGGSIKDRVAYSMMKAMQDEIKPDMTVMEPSSGNTGIGIAMNCAYNDIKCVVLTRHKCSSEKVNKIRLVGANIAYVKDGESEINTALELQDKGGYYMLDQFTNEINPQTHYNNTAEEILGALTKVDYLVCGAGTGGTMTGAATKLKEKNPNCKLVVADIKGSKNFHDVEEKHPFQVEGITGDGGSDVPIIENKELVDIVEVVTDKDAFLMARELAKKEAILCGGSAGMAVRAAIQYAKTITKGTMVVILPDGICNSMSKFVSDQWMEAHLYKAPPKVEDQWYKASFKDLINKLPENHKKLLAVYSDEQCKQVLRKMIESNTDVAIVNKRRLTGAGAPDEQTFVGLASLDSIRHRATDLPHPLPIDDGKKSIDDAITESMDTEVKLLPLDVKCAEGQVGLLSRVLDISRYVILGDAAFYKDESLVIKTFSPIHVVSADDVAKFIMDQTPRHSNQQRERRSGAYCTICHE